MSYNNQNQQPETFGELLVQVMDGLNMLDPDEPKLPSRELTDHEFDTWYDAAFPLDCPCCGQAISKNQMKKFGGCKRCHSYNR